MDSVEEIKVEPDPIDPSFVQLSLGGSLSIRNIKNLHTAAENVLGRDQHVRVDCSQATDLDLAAIQVLIALAVDLSRQGKECRVIGIPDQTADLMRHAGL